MAKTFIEIGTSDFDTLHKLTDNGWTGVFIEPVKHLFDNLKKVDGCHFFNGAIHTYDGEITIKYMTNPQEQWERGIGYVDDFSGNTVISNRFWQEDFKNQSESIVPCLTLDSLLKKYNIQEIDFLKIDTEGSEWKIMENFSWSIKPKVLKVEFVHWESVRSESGEAINHGKIEEWITKLSEMGYLVYKEDQDIYAIL